MELGRGWLVGMRQCNAGGKDGCWGVPARRGLTRSAVGKVGGAVMRSNTKKNGEEEKVRGKTGKHRKSNRCMIGRAGEDKTNPQKKSKNSSPTQKRQSLHRGKWGTLYNRKLRTHHRNETGLSEKKVEAKTRGLQV